MTTLSPSSSDPGTARSSRKASASLPVLRMPRSVSIAAWEVTTQSGRGRGPRHSGSTASQVGQRGAAAGAASGAGAAESEAERGGSGEGGEGSGDKGAPGGGEGAGGG